MIVSGGENVFPKEIEDCLVGHASVDEAAADRLDDAEFGTRLRAFVSVTAEVTEDELRKRQGQPGAVQGAQEIVFVHELPRNATGKILKRELTSWDENA